MSDPNLVAVARVVDRTRAEGPGERTAIWVQGCAIRCPGCFNPHLWTPRGGRPTPPADLVARVLAAGTDGLTLLGGEPFEQAAALATVAAGVRDAGRSVMTFTGYDVRELDDAVAAGRDDVAALLAATDLLVAGPYRQDLPDPARPWVGSTNQEIRLLSDRFPDLLDDLPPDRVEVSVGADGTVALNGWASVDALETLLDGLDLRRSRGPV